MLGRFVDPSLPSEVRQHITVLTAARLVACAGYRFAPPFLATIASGLDVSLGTLGVALAIAELAGLTSPLIGRLLDGWDRRRGMAVGLAVLAAGGVMTATATHVATFAIGLLVLGVGKIAFDLGLGAWIADHVPFARRGRVVGLAETSWALGLLLGVSALALVVAAGSWRWGYAVAVVGVVVMATLVRTRLTVDHTGPRPAAAHTMDVGPSASIGLTGWITLAAMFALMSGSQFAFVTFGSWLEHDFDFTARHLAAVTFGLGAAELAASTLSVRRTDVWGKERSIALGAAMMAPLGIGVAIAAGSLPAGLALLGAYVFAFEFAVVSTMPLGTHLVPGAPARGLGMLIGAGTCGRAVSSIAATAIYERHGFGWSMAAGSVAASITVAAILTRRARLGREVLAVAGR